ncbi:unnamed protein product, partial [Owenia fusiformis]
IDKETSFTLNVSVTVNGNGVTSFADGEDNYEYKFYLSTDEANIDYEIDYTPDMPDLQSPVGAGETAIHSLGDDDFMLAEADVSSYCGKIYFTVVLFDLKNKGPDVSSGDVNARLVQNNKDPRLRNSYVTREMVLKCPGDLFAMKDLNITPPSLFEIGPSEIDVSVTVTNVHGQGYDIPESTNQQPNFNFMVYKEEGLSDIEVPMLAIDFDDVNREQLTYQLLFGDSLTFTFKMTLDIDTVLCSKIQANEWYLTLGVGVGMPQGFIDLYNDNEVIVITGVSCDAATDLSDITVSTLSISSMESSGNGKLPFQAVIQELGTRSYVQDAGGHFSFKLWLSHDDQLDMDTDVDLGYDTSPHASTLGAAFDSSNSIVIDATASNKVELEASHVPEYCGAVYIIMQVDDLNAIDEPNKVNNIKAAVAFIAC